MRNNMIEHRLLREYIRATLEEETSAISQG